MSSKKFSHVGGIPGYEVKLWHHDVIKPIIYGIHKEIKPRHYLDTYLKGKAHVPPPNSYTIAKDMTIKANIITGKSAKITHAMEIEKQAKKDKFPDMGSYSPNHK